MLKIEVKFDRFPRLPEMAAKQIPFATSKAINATAKDFQKAERRQLEQRFTLRRPQFIKRSIRISRGDFATKRKLEATIRVDVPPKGPKMDELLGKFEKGGRKVARQAPELSIPIGVRRGKTGVVPKGQRPTALGFPKSQRRRVSKGKARTFLIPSFGIFKRVGRRVKRRGGRPRGLIAELKAGRIRLLYGFKGMVPLPADLGFVDTARKTVTRRYGPNFHRAFEDAMRTAR